jgi:hypothetical protein
VDRLWAGDCNFWNALRAVVDSYDRSFRAHLPGWVVPERSNGESWPIGWLQIDLELSDSVRQVRPLFGSRSDSAFAPSSCACAGSFWLAMGIEKLTIDGLSPKAERRHNYLRDYDPAMSRYVQSVPIGLVGGNNTFAYVRVRPVSTLDPLGLADCIFNISTFVGLRLVEPDCAERAQDGALISQVAISNPGIRHRESPPAALRRSSKPPLTPVLAFPPL